MFGRKAHLSFNPVNVQFPQPRFVPTGTLQATPRTIGGSIEGGIAKALNAFGMSERRAQEYATRTMAPLNDATPVGNVTGAEAGGKQFYHGLTHGDLAQMGLGAASLGLSVMPGAIGKGAKKLGKGMFGNLMRDTSGAIRAWHGSPHDFDRFNMSKIGTGEGAQAYGRGLYFAENKRVADDYRRMLSPKPADVTDAAHDVANHYVMEAGGDRQKAAQMLYDYVDSVGIGRDSVTERTAQHILNPPGRLYEVNINAETGDFLDWDAPVNQQKVADVLGMSRRPEDAIHSEAEQIMMAHPNGAWMKKPELRARIDQLQAELDRRAPNLSGADFYRQTEPDNYLHTMLSSGNGISSRSQELRSQGIPGIRYLDQGSRNAADGTRNYVVFDDSLIDILNKF